MILRVFAEAVSEARTPCEVRCQQGLPALFDRFRLDLLQILICVS